MLPNTTGRQRFITIDALRGFALLGIMLAHFIYWYTAGPLPEEVYRKYNDAGSGIAGMFNEVFISGKFFSFFSFLFGLSFYLQLGAGENKSGAPALRYAWRLVLLMLIGLMHHALWMGDILSIYAPLGFLLLLMRRLSNKWVLGLGLLLAVNLPGKIISIVQFAGSATPGHVDFAAMAGAYNKVITGSSWWQLFVYNLTHFSSKIDFQIFSGRLFITLGFFLLGMYAGRKKWFQLGDVARPVFQKIFKRSTLIGVLALAIGLSIMAGNAFLKLGLEQNPYVGFVFSIVHDVFNASLVVFIISGLTLLMYRRRWQSLLHALAPVGKMALTSYITQTVFGLLFFYGAGMGMYTKTSPGLNYLMAIGFFAVQVVFSKWWLQHFQFGPLEWLWRSGTYLRWQPFIKQKRNPFITEVAVIPDKVLIKEKEEITER